jgi:hypothetical protein
VSLIVDGRLTIPLYHGTSSLFYESIKKFGLGGHDLIKELRVIELLRSLFGICRSSLPDEEEWMLRMEAAERICQQEVTRGGFNFRHGSAYLTPSSYRAADYATSNEYGSEALGHFMMLWHRLQENRIELSDATSRGAEPIVRFATGRRTPILIQLDGVPAKILAAENGGDASGVLQELERYKGQNIFEIVCQQWNFELLGPIQVREVLVSRIVGHSRGNVAPPSLAPYRPAE